ncbi:hypothetical protein [Methylobacterium dankookense]|uniref:Uncharacterized protein n=1 Tax=Methylobacterium dankookense TaxID=560405 RepID=A0A564G5E3_9HYPH|nr:hypothetical protein [Methylobacterium dankookense]GJD55205.1 hypothetical protein IFDJLNFL_1089 [Methylobacterium dankookense]VUF15216.1 hypothetical protein MTDSW087_04951 [Methylobacterium dankookense]
MSRPEIFLLSDYTLSVLEDVIRTGPSYVAGPADQLVCFQLAALGYIRRTRNETGIGYLATEAGRREARRARR